MADKEFLTFLKAHKIRLKGNMVHVDDAYQIPDLLDKYERQKAIKTGLPGSLAPHADTLVVVSMDHVLEGLAGQDLKKYHLVEKDSWKNYEDGTWGGTFEGKVKDLYKFGVKWSGSIGFLEDDLLEAVKKQHKEV